MSENVFDQTRFLEAFLVDLKSARSFVFIQSPFISEAGVERLIETLSELAARGIRVCLFVQEPRDWSMRANLSPGDRAKLDRFEAVVRVIESTQIHLSLRKGIHEKVAVIDGKVLWDGSLNILSFNPNLTTERMTRLASVYKALEAVFLHRLSACGHCTKSAERARDPQPLVVGCDSIGAMIADMRREKGILQQELANHADLNRSTLGKIELGISEPRLETVEKVFAVMDFRLAAIPAHAVPFVEEFLRVFFGAGNEKEHSLTLDNSDDARTHHLEGKCCVQ